MNTKNSPVKIELAAKKISILLGMLAAMEVDASLLAKAVDSLHDNLIYKDFLNKVTLLVKGSSNIVYDRFTSQGEKKDYETLSKELLAPIMIEAEYDSSVNDNSDGK